MRFGLLLSGEYDPRGTARDQVARLLVQASTAVETGFSSLWLGEHFLTHPRPTLETVPLLARLTQVERVELGGVFVVPLHHPLVLAEQVRTLDRLSESRFVFCAALGWRQEEFTEFGVAMADRRVRLEEGVAAVKRLRAELVGDTPAKDPGPLVMLAGSSAAGLRRAARLGDGWLASAHTKRQSLQDLIRVHETELTLLGRSSRKRAVIRHCFVSNEGGPRASELLDEYYRSTFGRWGLFSDVPGTGTMEEVRTEVSERMIGGTDEEILNSIGEYEKLGFDEIVLNVALPGLNDAEVLHALRRLGTDIFPRARAAR